MSVAIAIRACRPRRSLIELLRRLSETSAGPILLVDDGSGKDSRAVFAEAAEVPGVEVLRHAVPRGRVAALQTAVNHILCIVPEVTGVVIADFEEQEPDHILQTADDLRTNPQVPSFGPDRSTWAFPAAVLVGLLEIEVPQESAIAEVLARMPKQAPAPHAKAAQDSEPWLPPIPLTLLRTLSFPTVLLAIVFAVMLGVEVHGFQSRWSQLFTPDIWFPVGLKRFLRYLGAFLALGVPLLVMVPWTFAGVIAALLVVLTAVSVGPIPLLATGFFLVSCWALGRQFLGQSEPDSVTVDLCATLLGSGVYVFLMTFLVRVSVNYPIVWGLLLAIPIILAYRRVWERLRGLARRISTVQLCAPGERIGFALLAFILGAQWFVAMLPETGADGLAMHLAVPMDIAAHHRMTFAPARFVWSVMPMGADWLYSIVYLLGGEYSARILNYAMLLAIVALLYRAARRWVSPGVSFLIAASLAASPVVQFVTGSLFVENYLVALVLGLMTAIWHFGKTGERRFLYAAMALGGTAMATKYGALVFVVLALPLAAVEAALRWKELGPRPRTVCAMAVLLLLATALPTYAIAYIKTGNPIYPFLNKQIHSPLLNPDVEFRDARFHVPMNGSTLYDLTFHSSIAYEGQDGSFGFQYLVAVPLILAMLVVIRRGAAPAAAIVGLAGAALVLASTPNIRYLYTSMPLIAIALAGLLGWMQTNQRWLYLPLIAYLFVATAFNVYFLPASSFYHKDFCLRLPFSRAERDRFRAQAAPIRTVFDYYNRVHGNSAILLTSMNANAGLDGDVYINNWHQYPSQEQIRAARTPRDMLALAKRWNVGYFLTENLPLDDQSVPAPLDALVRACGATEFTAGGFSLERLRPDCVPPATVQSVAEIDPAKQATVEPGVHDDVDRAEVYLGDWTHDRSFAEPFAHTVSYDDVPGDEVSLAFNGQSVTYVFTKAPNRGKAAVSIDGTLVRTIDLYSPNIEWQSRETFCCYAAGRHRIVVQVTDQANEKSSGKFVDLDAFVVQ